MLQKRWRVIATGLLLGVGAAAALAWTEAPTYQASTQLFVAAADTATDLNGLAQGSQFTQQRVQSYAAIVNTPELTSAVAAQLGHGLTAARVSREVRASAPANSVLIDVTVKDRSPARAAEIANAVSFAFSGFVDRLETPSGARTSPVKVSVVRRASTPTSPASPRKTMDLALGAIIGVALGLGAAVARESLDRSVKDATMLQSELGTVALGVIPFDARARKSPIALQSNDHSVRAEAFRHLRTNLQFVNVDSATRSLVVTSSVPDEGKTSTATNLAIAVAQTGARVVLVEADLRRPRVAEYLGLEGAVGLTSVLVGSTSLRDAIQCWGPNNDVHFLASGALPPNPTEVLGSQGMREIVTQLERDYDLVLIDAPPLLPVADAAVISTVATGTLVVARYGRTKRDQLRRTIHALQAVDSRVFGVVLTMVPSRSRESHYYRHQYGRRGAKGGPGVIGPVALAPSREGADRDTVRRDPPFASPTVRTLTGVDVRGEERFPARSDEPEQFFGH